MKKYMDLSGKIIMLLSKKNIAVYRFVCSIAWSKTEIMLLKNHSQKSWCIIRLSFSYK